MPSIAETTSTRIWREGKLIRPNREIGAVFTGTKPPVLWLVGRRGKGNLPKNGRPHRCQPDFYRPLLRGIVQCRFKAAVIGMFDWIASVSIYVKVGRPV